MIAQHQGQPHRGRQYHQCPEPSSHGLTPQEPIVAVPSSAEGVDEAPSVVASSGRSSADCSACPGNSAGSASAGSADSALPADLAPSSRNTSMACSVLPTVGSLTSMDVSAIWRAIFSAC